MRLLTFLTLASGALALATGPVHRPADQQAVDDNASLHLENAVLVDHEITRRGEEAPQSLEKRGSGAQMRNIFLPSVFSPAPFIINGVKITYTMGVHWVHREGYGRIAEYYVKSMQLFNQLNRNLVVQIVVAGAKIINQSMSPLGQVNGDVPENAQSFDVYITESHTEL
ncbi:hypothetical protein E4U58_004618 [Claviceps cyperi]|nr:hypothetical protein E4U58_004618 [Claviceps cyperi]